MNPLSPNIYKVEQATRLPSPGSRDGRPTSEISLIPAPFSRGGFTILELLVSMIVLVLLVMVVAQLTDATARSVKTSGQHMDAESQMRVVFDRMANDFAKMVRRKDADCLFYKKATAGTVAGNDAMFFYSEAPAYYDFTSTTRLTKSNVALIGYRINTGNTAYPNTPVLERLGMGLTWDGAVSGTANGAPVFLTTPTGSATPDPASTLVGNWGGNATSTLGTLSGGYSDGVDVGSYHVLGDLVYRMEIQFLLTDGTLSLIPVTNPSATTNNLSAGAPPTVSNGTPTYAPGSRWFDTAAGRGYICTSAVSGAATWNPIGVQDVSAIVVTLAVLDSNSRKIIPSTSVLSGAPLADAASGIPVAKTWMDAVNGSTFAADSGIPQAAAKQVRIYQRTFSLNNP